MIVTFSFAIFWMGKVNSEVKQANCVLSKIPSDFLDGVTGNEFEFMGLTNYLNVMNDFIQESGTILTNNLSEKFDNVLGVKINEQIKPYEDSLKNFKTNNQGENKKTKRQSMEKLKTVFHLSSAN